MPKSKQLYFDRNNRYIQQDKALPKAVICDLDGTLAILNGRNPYKASSCERDILNMPVADLLKLKKQQGVAILLLSGRLDLYRPQTVDWLKKHQIPYDLLVLRAEKDGRKDGVVKREFYETHVKGQYFVEFVLDDRNQVVDLWRKKLGLPCFQVYYGDF